MAVYIVTGKLGSGKTLLACMKIQEYLKAGRQVVTNIDINMADICSRGNDYSRVIRCPDQPTREDMDSIGMGYERYDEEMFGGIFLDEAGIWLNSRNWNKGGRSDFLEFLLYLRKRRWDLYLLVQNIKLVDKQIREAVAEHVVYLTRWDRVKIPGIGWLLGALTLGKVQKLPQIHHAVVKYGASHNALTSDNWYFRGSDYYNSYNTTQEFNEDYQSGLYSLLPPAYLANNHVKEWDYKKIMKLTKIYWKRFSRPVIAGAFFCVGAFIANLGKPPMMSQASNSPVFSELEMSVEDDSVVEFENPLLEYQDYHISSYTSFGDNYPVKYEFTSPDGDVLTTAQLKARGYKIESYGECMVVIKQVGNRLKLYCP